VRVALRFLRDFFGEIHAFLGFFVAFLAGCSTSPAMNNRVQQFNAAQEAQYSPTRAELKELPGGVSNLEFGVWAGVPGESAANAAYRKRIFDSFRTQCGFDESQLKEVRIVKHDPPIWYEVWVFNNPESQRPDNTSGLSVVMRFNPMTNITNTSFRGDCD